MAKKLKADGTGMFTSPAGHWVAEPIVSGDTYGIKRIKSGVVTAGVYVRELNSLRLKSMDFSPAYLLDLAELVEGIYNS